MKFQLSYIASCSSLLLSATSLALTISEINGVNYISALRDQSVSDVTGLVTAKGPKGIWLRSTSPDDDPRTSDSIYVYTDETPLDVSVGDIIVINGEVAEYRSSPDNLFLAEIVSPQLVTVESSDNPVQPVEISSDNLIPPGEQYSLLDGGDVFGVPNNSSQISDENPELRPDVYGMDFWESLSGELVLLKNARAISRPNRFGDTWVVGDWNPSGLNDRGGLTVTDADANPEAILIGTPLDGSSNPEDTKLGDELGDIIGIVTYGFGFYRVLPLVGLEISSSAEPSVPPPSDITGSSDCSGLSVGVYNVENLTPDSANLEGIADHIVNYMNAPALIFLQEVQDSNGPVNDEVVDANATHRALIDSIDAISDSTYEFVEIPPVDDQDGGQPGGNIRVSYLYNPDIIQLRNGQPGSSTDDNEVLPGPELKYNPGRIQPAGTETWESTRKPLVAAWETVDGQNPFYTVNVHFSSKGGSSSLEGNFRPPINGAVDEREAQAQSTAEFIADILREDSSAAVIAAGDFNEFSFVSPIKSFRSVSGLVNMDDVVNTSIVERYTYRYDMNCQSLDQMFVSDFLASKVSDGVAYEHIHVNTWAKASEEISDHDPSVARLNVCQG